MEYELKEALNELKESVLNKTMNEVKAVQDHVDKLDIKLQTVNKTKGIMNEQTDELKSLISKNYDSIKGVSKNIGVELKAAGNMTLSGNLTGNQNRDYQVVVATAPGQPLNFDQLVRTISIGVGSFTYPRETAKYGEFGTPIEGDVKNQISYDVAMIDVNTDFLAGFARISKKMLNNLPYMEGFLPQALRRDYYKSENSKFYVELSTQAMPSTLTSGNIVERIVNEATTLMNKDYFPNIVAINPTDYGKILLTAGPTGSGDYSLPGIVTTTNGVVSINGIMVVTATWVPADMYIIGDWTYCQKISTEGLSLNFFEQDADNVTKNLVTIRCEAQIGLAIQRPDAFIAGDFTSVA